MGHSEARDLLPNGHSGTVFSDQGPVSWRGDAMSTFSIPTPLSQPAQVRRVSKVPQVVASTEGRAMIKALGWIVAIVAVCLLTWQIAVDAPIIPRSISACILIVISVSAGIRISADGTAAYIKDVQRINGTLAEQHRQLEELNSVLLKELNAEIDPLAATPYGHAEQPRRLHAAPSSKRESHKPSNG